jgi:RAB protein geranylgeranyltransferase component A
MLSLFSTRAAACFHIGDAMPHSHMFLCLAVCEHVRSLSHVCARALCAVCGTQVFRDRSLSPLQKRTLMRFLKGCADALAGEGDLLPSFDARPFVDLMQQQGLDRQLQQFVLYGVLLLDTQHLSFHEEPQQQSGQQQQQSGQQQAASAAGAQLPSAPATLEAAGGGEGHSSRVVTAQEALQLLSVYVESLERYGPGTGPFLTPMYGCGELPQVLHMLN